MSITSLMPTHSIPALCSCAARNVARPVRPKPLMPTLTVMDASDLGGGPPLSASHRGAASRPPPPPTPPPHPPPPPDRARSPRGRARRHVAERLPALAPRRAALARLACEHPRPVAPPVPREADAQSEPAPRREHVRRADVPRRRDHRDLADAPEREHDRQRARRVAGGVAAGHLQHGRHAREPPRPPH